jgi:hypothetical protein
VLQTIGPQDDAVAAYRRCANHHPAHGSPEQIRRVELLHDAFLRAGARLSADDKARLGEINQELAVLFTDFGNKVLADEDTWIVLDKPADLAGLSDSLRASYKAAADERKLVGRQHDGAVQKQSDPDSSGAPGPQGMKTEPDNARRQAYIQQVAPADLFEKGQVIPDHDWWLLRSLRKWRLLVDCGCVPVPQTLTD